MPFSDSRRADGQLYSSCRKRQPFSTIVACEFIPTALAKPLLRKKKKVYFCLHKGSYCLDGWEEVRCQSSVEEVLYEGGPLGSATRNQPSSTPTLTPIPTVMSSPVPPSRKTLLHLYAATLRASRGFSSYNFRNYFLARTKDAFRGIQVRSSLASCLTFLTEPFRTNQTRPSSHHSTIQP